MVSAIPHAPVTADNAVDGTGHANGETLYAAREPRRCICLHQQVEMIGLNAEVEETEGTPRSGAERALDHCE
jgi:hypothetical protein